MALVALHDSRVYHDLAEEHGITSYPWVTSFYKGKKVEDMAGRAFLQRPIFSSTPPWQFVCLEPGVRLLRVLFFLKPHAGETAPATP